MVEGRSPARVLQVTRRGRGEEEASLPEEAQVAVLFNGEVVARLAASPVALEELALGHLLLAGRIRGRGDAAQWAVHAGRGELQVRVHGRGGPAKPPQPALPRGPRLGAVHVQALMKALLAGAALYREGGGVHTSALAKPEGLALLAADVGKVNTLDRLAGMALLRGVPTKGHVLLTTGRLTAAMVARALALGCPVLVSLSGPTTQGLALARKAEATLVGYARGGGFNVYCGRARIAQRPARGPKGLSR